MSYYVRCTRRMFLKSCKGVFKWHNFETLKNYLIHEFGCPSDMNKTMYPVIFFLNGLKSSWTVENQMCYQVTHLFHVGSYFIHTLALTSIDLVKIESVANIRLIDPGSLNSLIPIVFLSNSLLIFCSVFIKGQNKELSKQVYMVDSACGFFVTFEINSIIKATGN